MDEGTRLVDYVAIVGFDFEVSNHRNPRGKILQRFPVKDWPDSSFIDGIEFFCQPLGWELVGISQKQTPKFFQFVLTDIEVDRHYCACLTFHEAVQNNNIQQEIKNYQQETEPQLLAPKCIVLISRFDYREIFRNCLGILYAVHVDELGYSLEVLIGNLLTAVKVPPPGRSFTRFSLSAGDCLAIQPPQTETIPVTSTTAYRLIEHLGINNIVELFYALLTEHKILFYSQSYTRLNEACQGLISLMYPFKYSHTYIPVLPATLIEFLSTPTPFIIGVHSSLKKEISEILDVIIVDIDGGSVKVPDSLHLAHLEEPYNSQLVTLLVHITRPHIINADDAFVDPEHAQPSSPDIMDKEIRAVFLRTITQILQGYRSCLTVIRIHPKSLISFHKASFLGQRGFVDNEFMTRLLDTMFFEKYVESRGSPYRECDLFDHFQASLHEKLKKESGDIEIIIRNVKNLAQSLWEHENPAAKPPNQKAIEPTKQNATKIVKTPFPKLDSSKIEAIVASASRKNSATNLVNSNTSDQTISNSLDSMHLSSRSDHIAHQPADHTKNGASKFQFVPMGLTAEQVKTEFNANEFVINSARRLEVMRNCVNYIFDNKISDARKALPAVLKALNNKANRLALISELGCHVGSQSAVLEHQQFDLVVRLLNCALQHEGPIDLNGVAAKILPLAVGFCRKLRTGVMQFAYTCIQDHQVWSNQQFWESSFHLDVEKNIINLYNDQNLDTNSNDLNNVSDKDNTLNSSGNTEIDLRSDAVSSPSSTSTLNKTVIANNDHTDLADSGLEVASRQLQLYHSLSEEGRKSLIERWSTDEESIVYSQAIHFVNVIVCMKVPLNAAELAAKSNTSHVDSSSQIGFTSSQKTHSNGSDRLSMTDDPSGSEEEPNRYSYYNSEVANNVIKFISRFVDKVCIDCNVGENHIKNIHIMIPQVVGLQIESLESVYRESKQLPPVMKPKITKPDLIPGEELLMSEGLRTYLLPDGRDKDNVKDESVGAHIGGPIFLPAEGGIFITNYRIIFKGRPCDPFYCEQTIVRSFPVATLTKEKRMTVHAVPAVDQCLSEGLQLRSTTFQLIRIAFDKEVTSDNIDSFRKHVIRQRLPGNIYQLFTFTSQINVPNKSALLNSNTKTSKSSTLKVLAKRSKVIFTKGAQKAGLKKKESSKTAAVWRHARTKAILMRSSSFQSKGVIEMKPGQTLYILCEKNMMKSIKSELYKYCEFVPLDIHEVRQVKYNFVKFLRACVPSGPLPPQDSKNSLAKTFEAIEWFDQLKAILDASNKIVDFMDTYSRNVLLSLEEGWDLTPQITSIAKLCMDPYYRTFEGFRILIEKEWLAFGHRFAYRSNQTETSSGFAPIFLQFLDLVHQIHRQFPLSFEFNQYYIKFLAYHHVSCRFRTFILDNETDRSDCGWQNEELSFPGQTLTSPKSSCPSSSGTSSSVSNSNSNLNLSAIGRQRSQNALKASPEHLDKSMNEPLSGRSSRTSLNSNSSNNTKTLIPNQMNNPGTSFWEYAEKLWNQSPIFFNYYYTPVNFIDPTKNIVLKPNSSIALMKLWDYYTSEDLNHGPSYDLEVFNMAKQHQEELMASIDQKKASKRRCMVTNYDNNHLSQPDGLTQLLSDLRNIELEYNLNPTQWTQLWSKIETSLPVD